MSELINALSALPPVWALTPVRGNKAAYLPNWQTNPAPRSDIAQAIQTGEAKGFGILTGTLSGGIMAIDCDGHIPHTLLTQILGGDIPQTVAFTSGKDGRAQYLFAIPQADWANISTKKAGTAKDGGMLEFRWDGCQSVLPPSAHPETGSYQWINSPDTTEIAPLPDKVLDYLIAKPTSPPPRPPQPTHTQLELNLPPIPIERCLSKEHRAALENGVSEGNRDDMGCSLARDLIGVASYVPSVRFDYCGRSYQLQIDGDPYDLLADYCRKCSPPLSQKDCDRIYKSARSFSPAPSINDDESLANCLRSWVKKHQPVIEISSEERESNRAESEYPKFATDIDQGLFKNTVKTDKETQEQIVIRERIGNHLEAIAYVNNPENNDASIHLKFKTIRGGIHTWTMPRAALVFETSQMLAELQKRGYYFNIDKKKQLVEYLNGLGGDINKTYIITDRTGWIGKEYVTQTKTYSTNPDSDLKFRDVEPIADSISEIKGTLAEWQEHVGSKCAFNSRLIFGVGTGLAAVLQSLIGMESGGFHIVGTTSVGKTTILKVASSVVGIKDIPHWRTTTNGLESIACAHNHMLLPLDEISQADPKEVGSIAYMLANGQGKVRMTKTLQNRKAKTWHLLFLSSGEFGMGAYMAQSGISLKGGQEVRLPDIPAVPSGSPFGAFESIHNFDSAKEFAESLDRATQSYTGTLLDAFLSKLVPDQENHQIANQLKRQVSAIARTLAAGTSDSAVARVANRFALVQVALEVAHSYGLLPFPVEHISWAISKVFHDWLNYRGGDGSIEVKNACERILNLFVTQEYSDRIYNLTDGDNRTIRNLLAYRKTDEDRTTDEFWVPITVFDKELCGGIDKIALIKELQKKEWLAPPRGDGKNTHQRRLNKTKTYFYIFQPKNFFPGISSEPGEPGEPVSYNSYSPMDITPSLVVHQEKTAGEPGEPPHSISLCAGSPGSPWFTEPGEPDQKSEMPSEHSFQAPGSPGSPGSPEKTNLEKINLDGRKNTGSLNLAAGDKVIMQTGNGSDSPDSPWFTEAVSQNGNSQILFKQPSQSSDSPDSPEKMQSQQIVDDPLSSSLKKGDKVIVQTSQAVGVAIDNRIKSQQSPKKGVFAVNQYLVEFEEGNRTWLDADVLVLDDRN